MLLETSTAEKILKVLCEAGTVRIGQRQLVVRLGEVGLLEEFVHRVEQNPVSSVLCHL